MKHLRAADNSMAIDASISKWNDSIGYDPKSRPSDSAGGGFCGISRARRVPGYTLIGALGLGFLRRLGRRRAVRRFFVH